MGNTIKRIVSALILIILLVVLTILGKSYLLSFLGLVGVLVVDEIMVNFFRLKRSGLSYVLSQITFVSYASWVILIWLSSQSGDNVSGEQLLKILDGLTIASGILSLFCAYYLFCKHVSDHYYIDVFKKHGTLFLGFVVVLLIAPLQLLIVSFQDSFYLITLLLITAAMDTGAWFVGRRFGKHPLWSAISPKKTVEGFIGGILFAGVVVTLFIYHFSPMLLSSKTLIVLFLVVMTLAVISHLGDLFQSKIKRQFSIKDSSNLIPGHGGVYDRIDSLIFLAPFYYLAVRYGMTLF